MLCECAPFSEYGDPGKCVARGTISESLDRLRQVLADVLRGGATTIFAVAVPVRAVPFPMIAMAPFFSTAYCFKLIDPGPLLDHVDPLTTWLLLDAPLLHE